MRTSAILSIGALLLALGLHLAITSPRRHEAQRLQDQYNDLRDQRRKAQARVGQWTRRAAAHERLSAVARQPGASRSSIARRAVLRLIEGARLTGVQITVQGAPAQASVIVRLTAHGAFLDLVRTASDATQADTGLVLRRVRLSSASDGATMDAEVACPD
jgi:hypothetical protein